MVAILAASILFIVIWLYQLLQRIGEKWRADERVQKVLVDYKNEFNKYPRDTKGGK